MNGWELVNRDKRDPKLLKEDLDRQGSKVQDLLPNPYLENREFISPQTIKRIWTRVTKFVSFWPKSRKAFV